MDTDAEKLHHRFCWVWHDWRLLQQWTYEKFLGNYSCFLSLFLGTGMMVGYSLHVGASSWFKTMLNICRRYSISWSFPCFRTSAVTLCSLPGDLPVLMLLVALETSSKVKFSVSILRLCSGVGNLSELVVELVLRSPLKYS